MKRTVVFDVGGVIVRWQPLELMREHLPMAAPEEAMRQVFQGWVPGADWVDFDLGRVEPEALAVRIAARTGYPRAAVAALIDGIPRHIVPMPESVALLRRVRDAGHRLALLSNMPRTYADHLEAAHACFGWFEHRVWSGRIGLAKPERAMFEHLRATLGLDGLHDAVFIDDHAGNIDAARALGWRGLHFTGAAQCADELARGGWLQSP